MRSSGFFENFGMRIEILHVIKNIRNFIKWLRIRKIKIVLFHQRLVNTAFRTAGNNNSMFFGKKIYRFVKRYKNIIIAGNFNIFNIFETWNNTFGKKKACTQFCKFAVTAEKTYIVASVYENIYFAFFGNVIKGFFKKSIVIFYYFNLFYHFGKAP